MSFLRVARSSTASFARRLTSLKSRRALFEVKFHMPVLEAAKKPSSCSRDWTRRMSASVNDSSRGGVAGFASWSGSCEEDSALASFAVTTGWSGTVSDVSVETASAIATSGPGFLPIGTGSRTRGSNRVAMCAPLAFRAFSRAFASRAAAPAESADNAPAGGRWVAWAPGRDDLLACFACWLERAP